MHSPAQEGLWFALPREASSLLATFFAPRFPAHRNLAQRGVVFTSPGLAARGETAARTARRGRVLCSAKRRLVMPCALNVSRRRAGLSLLSLAQRCLNVPVPTWRS